MYCVSQVEGVHSQSPAQDIIGDYSDTGTIPIKHKRTLTYTIWADTSSKTAQCIPIFVTSKSLILNLDNMTSSPKSFGFKHLFFSDLNNLWFFLFIARKEMINEFSTPCIGGRGEVEFGFGWSSESQICMFPLLWIRPFPVFRKLWSIRRWPGNLSTNWIWVNRASPATPAATLDPHGLHPNGF